jgi:tetratricopeptide (TPR) repeat protein
VVAAAQQGLHLALGVLELLGVGLEGPRVHRVLAEEVLLGGRDRDVDLRVVTAHLVVVHLVGAEVAEDPHDPEADTADEDLAPHRLLAAEDVVLQGSPQQRHRGPGLHVALDEVASGLGVPVADAAPGRRHSLHRDLQGPPVHPGGLVAETDDRRRLVDDLAPPLDDLAVRPPQPPREALLLPLDRVLGLVGQYLRLTEGTSSDLRPSPVLRARSRQAPPSVAPALPRPAEAAPPTPAPSPDAGVGAVDSRTAARAGHGSIEAPRAGLVAVRLPDMAVLEPVVARQLGKAQRSLERLLADPSATDGDLAAAYGFLGRLYHAYELSDPALDCYENAHTLAPGEVQWVDLRADVHRQSAQPEAALEQYGTAIEIGGTSLVRLVRIGEALLQTGRLDEARDAYDQALALAPASPAALAGRGRVAVAMGDNAAAVTLLEAALSAISGASSLHYQLALAYRGLGRTEEARRHMARRGSVGIGVPDPLLDGLQDLVLGERVHILRGRRAFLAGAYADAAREFQQAVDAAPDSVRARVNLGSALGEMGDRAGAIERFREALRLEPRSRAASFNLGALLQDDGQCVAAAPLFEAALEANPGDAEAHLRLAQCLSALGRRDEAISHFIAARDHEPTAEDAMLGHARILVARGDFPGSLEVLEEAHRRMPRQGRTAHALARLLAASPDPALRDGERALDLALRVFEASPDAGHAETVAQALAQCGRCGEASEWQERAIELLPEVPESRLERMRSALVRYEGGLPCPP